MRSFMLSGVIAAALAVAPSVSLAASPAWTPATATNITAGAGHSNFMIHASVTLPQSCYAARIRSTPISLHSPREFYVEQMGPSSPCTKPTNNYTCTVVSPAFPLPIPQSIEVLSKGQKTKVHVAAHEPAATPPVCSNG